MRVVSRIAWAIVIAGLTALLATAVRVERWIGGGSPGRLRFDVEVPDVDATAAAVEAALLKRLRGRAPHIMPVPAHDGGGYWIDVDGTRAEVDLVRDLLTRPGRLELTEVLDATRTAAAWYRAARDGALGPDVDGQTDGWSDADGRQVSDFYLTAPTAAALSAALAYADPALDDARVVYERVTPSPGRARGEPYVRTYLVAATPALTGDDVADARVIHDERTMRPEVRLRFTDDGAARFEELTRRIAGHKLAIVIDGWVASAPVVQSAIGGGTASITMGGGDAQTMEREARALVDVLRSRAELPDGITATLLVVRDGAPAGRWLPRLAVAFLLGLAAFVVLPRVGRGFPVTRVPVARGAAGLGRVTLAALLTFGLPIALRLLAPHVLLPGVAPGRLAELAGGVTGGPSRAAMSVFAVGLLPVVYGYWLAELVAALAPRWNARRRGTRADRATIDRIAVFLGLGFAALQALMIARFLAQLSIGGALLVTTAHDGTLALHVVTLVAGVAVLIAAAELISRHGLCNGYVAFLAVPSFVELVRAITRAPWPGLPDHRVALAAVLSLVLVVLVVASALRDDGPERRRLPWTGILPVTLVPLVAGVVFLVVQAVGLSGPFALRWLELLVRPPLWLDAVAAIALSVAIVGLRDVRHRIRRVRGVGVTLIVLAVVLACRHVGVDGLTFGVWVFPLVWMIGLAFDGLHALVARLPMARPTAILAIHDVDRADRAADALAVAGIAASIENRRTRALLRGLGGFAPIVIRVDRADAERAIAAIGEAEAARDPRVAAFAD